MNARDAMLDLLLRVVLHTVGFAREVLQGKGNHVALGRYIMQAQRLLNDVIRQQESAKNESPAARQ